MTWCWLETLLSTSWTTVISGLLRALNNEHCQCHDILSASSFCLQAFTTQIILRIISCLLLWRQQIDSAACSHYLPIISINLMLHIQSAINAPFPSFLFKANSLPLNVFTLKVIWCAVWSNCIYWAMGNSEPHSIPAWTWWQPCDVQGSSLQSFHIDFMSVIFVWTMTVTLVSHKCSDNTHTHTHTLEWSFFQ